MVRTGALKYAKVCSLLHNVTPPRENILTHDEYARHFGSLYCIKLSKFFRHLVWSVTSFFFISAFLMMHISMPVGHRNNCYFYNLYLFRIKYSMSPVECSMPGQCLPN